MNVPGYSYVSTLELFSIGVGPSSSHTVGPMRAAREFAGEVVALGGEVRRIRCELAGSLGATGRGHGTPAAVLAGFEGHRPETVDPGAMRSDWASVCEGSKDSVRLLGTVEVTFEEADISFHPLRRHSEHPNALTFVAEIGDASFERTYLSVGGGFIRPAGAANAPADARTRDVPHAFTSTAELLQRCRERGWSIAEVIHANEVALHGEQRVQEGLDAIVDAMFGCIDAGMHARGTLPGGLGVPRRAAEIAASLGARSTDDEEWLLVYALAVNEQNAAGERVVTAPTNGAAGVLPAVLRDHVRRFPSTTPRQLREMLLTATAVGGLIKNRASISGAEAGCQGEVGSACAMAAAALTAVLGGAPAQVENAAEIALEHHLGLTCDPIGGLVQIPCIERNAVAASTARTASRIALRGDGSHLVSFDMVVEVMRRTGADMSHKYKETSEAGLAVAYAEC